RRPSLPEMLPEKLGDRKRRGVAAIQTGQRERPRLKEPVVRLRTSNFHARRRDMHRAHVSMRISQPSTPVQRALGGLQASLFSVKRFPVISLIKEKVSLFRRKQEFPPNLLESLTFSSASRLKTRQGSLFFRINREQGGQTGVGRGRRPMRQQRTCHATAGPREPRLASTAPDTAR